MYGLVIYIEGDYFAAVSASKRKLQKWLRATHDRFPEASARNCAWRMGDETGWSAASDNAHEIIGSFPGYAEVLW